MNGRDKQLITKMIKLTNKKHVKVTIMNRSIKLTNKKHVEVTIMNRSDRERKMLN